MTQQLPNTRGVLIARGAFSDVWKVFIDDGKVSYAAKNIRLPFRLKDSPEIQAKIQQTLDGSKQLCKLKHGNIVKFHDMTILTEESAVAISMELVDGITLEKHICGKPMDESTIRLLSGQICNALDYLHTLKPNPVLHRDLNSRSIMVTEDNKIKLIDFGLAVQLVDSANEHVSADPRCDPCFAAPELFLSENTDQTPYSCASDIWAFGCIFHQMATGIRPHAECKNLLTIVRRVMKYGAPKLPDGCSSLLTEFYSCCTEFDREVRNSAAQLLQHEFLNPRRISEATPEQVTSQPAEQESQSTPQNEQTTETATEDSDRQDCSPFREKWDTVRLLGRGAFGEVHEVLTDRGIRCAVKTIKPPVQFGDPEDEAEVKVKIRDAIECERNLCHLHHDNIVKFIYISESDHFTVVLFMELLEGRPLKKVINGKPLREETCSDFCNQICSALSYIHGLRPEPVIHRDIKCDNIMVLNQDNRIKLIDFGLSMKLQQSVTHHSASSFTPRGTLHFMAPQLFGTEAENKIVYSRESDIWAFGCTVFQMATGSVPHCTCDNMLGLAQLLAAEGAPPLPEGSSAELKNFYACCVVRDRKARKSAADLLSHPFLTGQRDEAAAIRSDG